MISSLLLIAALVALSLALRSYRHPLTQRIGTFLLLFGTSFLIGWLLLESLLLGIGLALTWLLLPWLEILTRARRLRLPADRSLTRCGAPDAERLPNLRELSADIRHAGFEEVDDLCWEHGDQRQYYRLFYQSQSGTEAAICLVEQSAIAFHYLAITTRSRNGLTLITWNYPFSYGLRPAPSLKLHRSASGDDFQQLLADHRLFLDSERIGVDDAIVMAPDTLAAQLESDMRRQIAHNLDRGVLKRDGDNLIRYSARGLLFLWCQFLRDLVRLS